MLIDILIIVFGGLLFITLICYFIYKIKIKKQNPFSECDCCNKGNKILKQYYKKYKNK